MAKKFNLVDELWILVRDFNENVRPVSLRTALMEAEKFQGLAGETEPQNAAILRILEAIVHKAVLENDIDGSPDLLEDLNDCLDRWEEIWNSKHLPISVEQYLDEHHDDFWLIDDVNPFMQVPLAKKGTKKAKKLSKLIGNISESDNKTRIFKSRSGEGIESLDFAEAARWLINLNAYDDTGLKVNKAVEEIQGKAENAPNGLKPGVGWLGKIGQIYALGQNLFDTLMLNCVLMRRKSEVYPPDQLSWELPQDVWLQRHYIPQPDNFGALMTLRSRLIILRSEGDKVTGFNEMWGEYFDGKNYFLEPFTIWKSNKKVQGECSPKLHTDARQLWRDFSSIFIPTRNKLGEEVPEPGIVGWLNTLMEEEVLPDDYPLIFSAPYVTYGNDNSSITEISSQNLQIYSGLLSEIGHDWLETISDQITKIDEAANYAGCYFENLARARGAKKEMQKAERPKGTAALYSLLNKEFSDWISTIIPEGGDSSGIQEEKVQAWIDTAVPMIIRFGWKVFERSIGTMKPEQIFGRVDTGSKNKGDTLLSTEAEMKFESQIKKLYPTASCYQEK